MTIKAILDTNVLISGIFWTSAPSKILQAWQMQRCRLVISPPILDEYRRVLNEMAHSQPSPVLGSILELIELNSDRVKKYQRVQIVRPAHFLKMLSG